MMTLAPIIALLILLASNVTAQTTQQSIRGLVQDKFNQKPLAHASINLIGSGTIDSTTSNESGEFTLTIPVGRYTLIASADGYNNHSQADIIVNSGKQVVLTIDLEEKVKVKLSEISATRKRTTIKTISEMSISSAREFIVSDASRYAGSLGDPARMAQNFAGVQTNSDSRNDIVIRGNSPLGVGWRLEGIEIPNPNHFSGIGTTGGSISIVNNNNLSNSAFLTGAFAPQYGNALAGFFDLDLRSGNNKQHEYMAQFGLNGAEFGAEGPLSKRGKGSYIINGRYSTLEVFDKLGIKLGANAQARYRDLTFKINLPNTPIGSLAIWGIGGYNLATSLSKNYDTSGLRFNPRPKGFDTYFNNAMFATGISQKIALNGKLTLSNTLSYNNTQNQTHVDSLYNQEADKFTWLGRTYSDSRINTVTQLAYKHSTQHQTQIGFYYTRFMINNADSLYLTYYTRYISLLSFKGSTHLSRAFVQHQYKPSQYVTIVAGIHAMYFGLNNTWAVEPRAAMRVQISPKLTATIGAGVHHQLQPLTTYFYNRTGVGNFTDSLTNKNLGFTRSNHLVAGAEWQPINNYRIKVDAYMQAISGAAIEQKATTYSTLNEGAFYYMIPKPYCINGGTGLNRGIELTVEKFFSKHYYFLLTSSLYKSTYVGGTGVTLPTAFDGRWTVNALGGYEFKVHGKHSLAFNAKFAALGGRPYILIDSASSQALGQTVLNESKAYLQRYPTYFRPDVRVSYRLNRHRISHEFGLNIDNIINYQNIQSIEYDNYRKQIGYSYQQGRLPVLQYKAEWNYSTRKI
jgi:hypothetical protein